MNRYMEVYVLQFKELLSVLKGNDDNYHRYDGKNGNYIANDILHNYLTISDMFDHCFGSAAESQYDDWYLSQNFVIFDTDEAQWMLTDYAKTVLRMIISRYANSYCVENYSLDEEILKEMAGDLLSKLVNVLNLTYNKYVAILEAYDQKKEALLSGVTTTSTGQTRFNDTPQNEGEFADDNHNTNITNLNSQVDSSVDTPIARIDEIERLYKTTLLRWTNEFKDLFWEEFE